MARKKQLVSFMAKGRPVKFMAGGRRRKRAGGMVNLSLSVRARSSPRRRRRRRRAAKPRRLF